MTRPIDSDAPDACHTCPLASRRTFLQQAAAVLAGLATLGGGAPAQASALTVRLSKALTSTGDEHTYPIPAVDGAQIDRDNQVILVRYQQKAYAFNLSCPHQNTALRWQPEDGQFQCPKHHSRYQPDGVYVSGRATRSMDRLGIRRDAANLVVDVSKFYRQDRDAAQWAEAVISL